MSIDLDFRYDDVYIFFVLGIRRVCCLYTANFLWLITLHCIIMITNLRIILRPISDIPAILESVLCGLLPVSSFFQFYGFLLMPSQ